MSDSASCVKVELADRSYDIQIRTDAMSQAGELLSVWFESRFGTAKKKALVVTDENVAPIYLAAASESLSTAGWEFASHTIAAGEQSKQISVAEQLYDAMVAMPADRQTVVIALGGGVVGDLAGFVAATFARGVPFVQIPTTLLAQVDSSVGGKTGVNHPKGKNLIGAFHQPLGVFIDTETLTTLSDRDYHAGLAEVVKYGLIMDEPFFSWLEENVDAINSRDPAALRYIVARCCELKADVVREDEFETTGRRAILNYGHTFAHAFEALSSYGVLLHGEAVSIGMVCAGRLGEILGRVDNAFNQRQNDLLAALQLPISLPQGCEFDSKQILDRMLLDKKTVGDSLRFVLPSRLGHVEVVRDVATTDVVKSL